MVGLKITHSHPDPSKLPLHESSGGCGSHLHTAYALKHEQSALVLETIAVRVGSP